MSKDTTPVAYKIHDGTFVTVPSESWNLLCEKLTTVEGTVCKLSEDLEYLTKSVDERFEKTANAIKICESDISKLATIVEGIYETLE